MQTITSPTITDTDRRAGWLGARPRLRRGLVVASIAATVAGASLASQATAQPATVNVKGTFANQIFTGPTCAAPAGLCFKGRFLGDIEGPDAGSVNSLTPTQQPDVVLGDASTTIHTRAGDLTCAHEQFVLNTSPASDGHFAWLCEITSGTGRYAGASGYLQGVGVTPDPAKPSTGTYVGKITLN